MLQINQRYIRKSPDGNETIIKITTEKELEYHIDLITKNYKYTLVVDQNINNVCLSCEG